MCIYMKIFGLPYGSGFIKGQFYCSFFLGISSFSFKTPKSFSKLMKG